MTNDDLTKTPAAAAPSTGSGYGYLALVTWLALLSVVALNTEIGMIVSVLLEIRMPIVFLFTCFVKMTRVISMIYLVYFWIKVIRKMLIFSTV